MSVPAASTDRDIRPGSLRGSRKQGYVLRGDNRDRDDLWRPLDGDVLGSRLLALPTHGRLGRLLFSPLALAALAAIVTFLFVVWPSPRRPEPEPDPEPQAA